MSDRDRLNKFIKYCHDGQALTVDVKEAAWALAYAQIDTAIVRAELRQTQAALERVEGERDTFRRGFAGLVTHINQAGHKCCLAAANGEVMAAVDLGLDMSLEALAATSATARESGGEGYNHVKHEPTGEAQVFYQHEGRKKPRRVEE